MEVQYTDRARSCTLNCLEFYSPDPRSQIFKYSGLHIHNMYITVKKILEIFESKLNPIFT